MEKNMHKYMSMYPNKRVERTLTQRALKGRSDLGRLNWGSEV